MNETEPEKPAPAPVEPPKPSVWPRAGENCTVDGPGGMVTPLPKGNG